MTNNNQPFFRRTSVRISAAVIVVILIALSLRGGEETTEIVEEATASPRTVSMHTISADNGTAVRTADGSAFIVRAQSGGRVDRVAKVGDIVAAGATVAQLENSAQRAAYIQAEGAYDAAVAAAGGNATSQSTAKQDAVRTWNSETVSTAQVMHNSIDTYFSFSRNSSITGFRGLEAFGETAAFNERRVAIEETLKAWERDTAIVTEANAESMLSSLSSELSVIGAFIDDLAALVPQQRINDNYTDEQRSADTTRTAITNSSGSNAAASNAQIKQALGALESARAALGKTVIKTPVAGIVTAVSISVGDIINVGNDVVFVAGNTAMETENTVTVPLTAVKFTPTKAFIFTAEEGKLVAHEVETGLVTSDSITVSGTEGVTDVVSDVRGLKEGDSVVIQ